jgi:hypothetical protein
MHEAPQRWTFAQTLKDPMMEEPINWRIHRPLAFWLVLKPIERLPWRPSPNQITLLSGAAGVAGGGAAFMAPAHGPVWFVVAALLLFASVLLDCSDGMLARLTGQTSEFGMLLDGLVDAIVGAAFWLGMTWTTGKAFPGALWLWPLSFTILLSIVLHCALYDHLRKRFTLLVRPDAPPQAPADSKGGWINALYQNTYVRVSVVLTGVSPDAGRPALPADELRARFARPMRMASWFGLGTQLAVIYTMTLLAVFWPLLPFFAALVLLGGVLNVWMIAALAAWKAEERAVASLVESAGK